MPVCNNMSSESIYTPIWSQLKKDKEVSLTANRLLHPRIIKAVTKRKLLDVAYKLEIEPRIAVLSHARKNSILTFFLEIKSHTLDFRSRGSITSKDF